MAGKVNVMKLLQELRGLAEFTSRRAPSKLPPLPAAYWRSQVSRMAQVRRKRTIRITAPIHGDIPDPVKIVHLRGKSPASPDSPAS